MTPARILDQLALPVWLIDPADGAVLWQNPAAADLARGRSIEAMRRGPLSSGAHESLAALAGAGPVEEVWTVGSDPAPQALHCLCRAFAQEDGRTALMVEGCTEPSIGPVAAPGPADALFRQALPPMLILDLDAHGRVIDANSAAEALYGLDRGSLMTRYFWQLDCREQQVLDDIESALRVDTGPWGGSCLHRAVGEPSKTVEMHVSPLSRGDPSRVLAVLIDVSDDRRLARNLMARQEELERLVETRNAQLETARRGAEVANEAKTNFLANMSHEIRTPLHAIFGMAQLIRRDGLKPRQLERLDKLDVASRHLADVITSILDLSTIESGNLNLSEETFDLNPMVRRVMSMLEGQAIAKGLSFVCEVSTPEVTLQGDATRLQQALLNLTDNAVKFTETGGVTLRAAVEDEDASSLSLRFEVQDSGIGISAELMEHLFAPFEQADNSSTRAYRGVGVGLSITRRIARLMGGDAGGWSEGGQGSTFWLTVRLKKALPVLDAAWTDAGRAEDVLRRDFSGCRVLLVEDDLINREIAMLMLAEAGQFFDVASDGEQAVMLAARHDYDLILMDLQLPRLSGQDAARRIRELPNGRRVPIIALTADVLVEDRESCFAAGMNDFVAKPMTFEVFCRTLLRWLAGRRRLQLSAE
ncbi:MAG: response regulator [Rhodocyclaceae bacterium]|nr:response regulator [Rhodocyclaceae bacterium]